MAGSLPVTIAVDALGGDGAPRAVFEGVERATAADPGLRVLIVGPSDVVEGFAAERPAVGALLASGRIGMDEHPASAVRSKRDSSIVVACDAVAEGKADGMFSAGNTGAVMMAATLGIGRLPNVSRPALAAVLPFAVRPLVLLDVGAQADVRPGNLVQFGHMGAAYAECVLGTPHPSVALLNLGAESTKGSQLTRDAYELMSSSLPSFAGNAEGNDLSAGTHDVIVTDGFTGNVCLKLLEGYTSWIFGRLRAAMTANLWGRAAAMMIRPSIAKMRQRLDPETYGGVPLLGVAGVCVIGHGSSSPRAVAAGIAAASSAVRGGLTDRIAAALGAPAPT